MNGSDQIRPHPSETGIARNPPFTVYRSPFTLLKPFTLFSVLTPLLLPACGGLSPLRGHAVVGRDAYLLFVGETADGQSDLFGVRADGGPVFQITYTPVVEAAPVLSPDGGTVAFLRAATIGDKKPGRVWVLNLLSGAERELQLRRGAAAPTALGWSEDGSAIYVRADTTVYRFVAPPASGEPRIVTDGERSRAESSLEVLVGQPPFGSVVPCGSDLCVLSEQSAPAPFASNAHDPVRWGPDSVGFVSGPDLIVRPVGPGHQRRLEWSGAPSGVRGLTFFGGESVNTVNGKR